VKTVDLDQVLAELGNARRRFGTLDNTNLIRLVGEISKNVGIDYLYGSIRDDSLTDLVSKVGLITDLISEKYPVFLIYPTEEGDFRADMFAHSDDDNYEEDYFIVLGNKYK
jgi:hypothetical protein